MAIRINLDMDVLRTFVTGFELGSFARAAERLGRSQSAVSTQLRKLEEQAGQPLVQKAGRGLALTPAGESLFGYAKRLLDLNDEAIDRLRGTELEGWARLGLVQDFAESWLPAVLRRFSRAYPRVRIEVQVGLGAQLAEQVVKGDLDIALVWGDGAGAPHARRVAEVPVYWIGHPDWPGLANLGQHPISIATFAPPCMFRSAAVAALDERGLPWRQVFTSPSLSGLWAAAEGGLGLTTRTDVGLPRTLQVLDPASTGLPPLPNAPLTLHQAEADLSPAVGRLADILLETIGEHVA